MNVRVFIGGFSLQVVCVTCQCRCSPLQSGAWDFRDEDNAMQTNRCTLETLHVH